MHGQLTWKQAGSKCIEQQSFTCTTPSTDYSTACEVSSGGGGSSLYPYSQQRPMRTNLSCCLGLIDNGQYKSTNKLLVVVPHEKPHGIMRILKNLCMLLPKALKMKMRATEDTMALVADSRCCPSEVQVMLTCCCTYCCALTIRPWSCSYKNKQYYTK